MSKTVVEKFSFSELKTEKVKSFTQSSTRIVCSSVFNLASCLILTPFCNVRLLATLLLILKTCTRRYIQCVSSKIDLLLYRFLALFQLFLFDKKVVFFELRNSLSLLLRQFNQKLILQIFLKNVFFKANFKTIFCQCFVLILFSHEKVVITQFNENTDFTIPYMLNDWL